jgi:hypothetical protein
VNANHHMCSFLNLGETAFGPWWKTRNEGLLLSELYPIWMKKSNFNWEDWF